MNGLRNPFAVRGGNMILIEDLEPHERGLKCQCQCPACGGEFIARMGDIKVHHFAHSKDGCDEVIAYTTGLYRLIHQILSSEAPFYVPALAITYSFPCGDVLNESNIASYVRIISEGRNAEKKKVISPGRLISFQSAELICDNKGTPQAIELTCRNSRMAIKVLPPATACKSRAVTAHKDMATLLLDYEGDIETIQAANSAAFQRYLLSKKSRKRWIQNPKVKTIYPVLIALSEEAYQEHQEQEKCRMEEQKCAAKEQTERRCIIAEQQAAYREEQKRLENERLEAERKAVQERKIASDNACYEQIKERDFQQAEHIIDSCGNRWIQCRICGERKKTSDSAIYGGATQIGLCTDCARAKPADL